jgi:two-component system, NtrC family, sensor kinase
MRQRPKPVKSKAKVPVARKSPKDGGTKVRDLEKRLAESLEREKAMGLALSEASEPQKATSEILRIISRSPTNLQPVLDAIATNAALVCDAYDAVVFLRAGDGVRSAAHYGPINITLPHASLSRGSVTEAAILDRQPVHVPDLLATEPPAFPLTAKAAREGGFRTVLSVPLLRENEAIGALAIRRREVQPFTDQQIELLKTFADQAVIAIENVRLFNETKEALEQQTATSEILRVISQSPTDVRPVFEAIAQSAARLCAAHDAIILRLDGDVLHRVAHHGPIAPPPFPAFRATRDSVGGRTVLDRQPIHVVDIQAEMEEFPEGSRVARQLGSRTVLGVPLLRDGTAMGVIYLRRTQVQPFTDAQIALLKTFADQAVIAIENVRLFNELQEKNQALTQAHAQVSEALDQQTATGRILGAISNSPTDVQPVFDAIVDSAVRLCDGLFGAVLRFDGELLHLVAHHNLPSAALASYERIFPLPPSRSMVAGRAVLDRAVASLPDVEADPELSTAFRDAAGLVGYRSIVCVPMLHHGRPLGTINVFHRDVAPFSETQITLLQTFADQAVIAIENVRLFTELQASNRELTTALDTQTATSDILRVMSHAQTDVRPVFDAILASAVRLLQGYSGVVTLVAGDQLDLAALTRTTDAGDAAVRALYPERLDSQVFQTLADQLEATTLPAIAREGGRKWMLANGLFGLWTNELILPEGASIIDSRELVATARPLTEEPPAKHGVYVHRLFGVDGKDVEHFVELSADAWNTFENTSDYKAEPQGLFRMREHPEPGGQMLLVTWYDRLESWERSRTPPPEAEANFRQRAMLTKRSIAIATRLVGSPGAPRGMGPG